MHTRLILSSICTLIGLSLVPTASATEYSSHISAPMWSSQEPLSISYEVVQVGLSLMSEKQVGLCLEEDMDPSHTYQGIDLPENNLRKEFIASGEPCKPLNERENFIRTEVDLDTGYQAIQYLDLSAALSLDAAPARALISWDIYASGVDGTFLRGTKSTGYYDPPTRIGSYRQTRPIYSTTPGEKLYRSRAIWSSQQDESGYRGFIPQGENRVWFHKARKEETTGTILVDIPRSPYVRNYGIVLGIDPGIKIESLQYVFRDGTTELKEKIPLDTLTKARFGGWIIKKSDLWSDIAAIEVKYSY